MMKYDSRDDDGDNYGNEDRNDDDNAAAGSGSDGMIFDPKTTPWSRLVLTEEDWATAVMALQPRSTMYIRVRLYIYPIKTMVKMCHKLLYAKIGIMDLY